MDNLICRLCGGCYLKTVLIDISQPLSKEIDMLSKIKQAIGIELNLQDQLPNKVCKNCVENIDAVIRFKYKCMETKHLLEHFIKEPLFPQHWINFINSNEAKNLICNFKLREGINFGSETLDRNENNNGEIICNNDEYTNSCNKTSALALDNSVLTANKRSKKQNEFNESNSNEMFCTNIEYSMSCDKTSVLEMDNSLQTANTRTKTDSKIQLSDQATEIEATTAEKSIEFKAHEVEHNVLSQSIVESVTQGYTCLEWIDGDLSTDVVEEVCISNGTVSDIEDDGPDQNQKCVITEEGLKKKINDDDDDDDDDDDNDEEQKTCSVKSITPEKKVKLLPHIIRGPMVRKTRRGISYNSEAADFVAFVDKNTYRCTICEAVFRWKYKAEHHIRGHSGERPFTCKYCDKTFSAADYLNKHVTVIHTKKRYTCEICGKDFARKYLLTEHIREHAGPPSFMCPHCDKMFYGKTPLAGHIINKHSGRDYICDVCGDGFKTKARLSDHIVRHKDKSIECTKCQRVFYTKQDLAVHLKRHDSSLPWHCVKCDVFFKTKRGLQLHNRTTCKAVTSPCKYKLS